MTISINEIASGIALKINTDIFMVQSYEHVKPGKGSAFVRIRMKNLRSQQVLERTFRSSETLEDIPLDERKLQLLYQSGDDYYFMDQKNFEEVVVHKDIIGDGVRFLKDHIEVIALANEHDILKVTLPTFIEVEITHTEPGFKGDSSRSGTKPATIETGATIQVPLFIDQGEIIKIDTRSGGYVERVKR